MAKWFYVRNERKWKCILERLLLQWQRPRPQRQPSKNTLTQLFAIINNNAITRRRKKRYRDASCELEHAPSSYRTQLHSLPCEMNAKVLFYSFQCRRSGRSHTSRHCCACVRPQLERVPRLMHAISTATTAYDTASLDLVLHPFNEDACAHGSLDTHSHSLQSDGFALRRCISRCVLVSVGSVRLWENIYQFNDTIPFRT